MAAASMMTNGDGGCYIKSKCQLQWQQTVTKRSVADASKNEKREKGEKERERGIDGDSIATSRRRWTHDGEIE